MTRDEAVCPLCGGEGLLQMTAWEHYFFRRYRRSRHAKWSHRERACWMCNGSGLVCGHIDPCQFDGQWTEGRLLLAIDSIRAIAR